MHLTFLLNKVYKPGYLKWTHRQFYKLPHLAAEIGPLLEAALATADCKGVVQILYPVLDKLIEFQTDCAEIPPVDYKNPPPFHRGFFAYDLLPVIEAVRETIRGDLRKVPFGIGALDQWVGDQDLLMEPARLKVLKGVYDVGDPRRMLFEIDDCERFL
jgi:hypothetical protein